MKHPIRTLVRRAMGAKIPPIEEIERFGMDGEEAVTRLLRAHFDTVVRNVAVPHKQLYLEKDLMVVCRGVAFVLEIKNWKGEIGCEGDKFYQNKENGVHKTLKSPTGTTRQFIKCLQAFYETDAPVEGIVVFCEPDCRLSLPREMDGIALLRTEELVPYIQARAKRAKASAPSLDPAKLLRCTRFYSEESEFCKGILADCYLPALAKDGAAVRLDTTKLRYITVEKHALRDKLFVTYENGASDVFYNQDAILHIACLDGTFRTLALNRIKHIVF